MMEELSVTETIEIKRRLASIRQIAAIDLIPNADAIDLATIDGWKVVVKKGEFKVNDYVVYFEIDSFIPNTIAPFLFKGRTYNGVEGERLRTKKLRGVVSQGLVLGINILPVEAMIKTGYEKEDDWKDVTEILGIQKWEREIPANLSGVIRGNFPSFIRKTDQERIQNLKSDFENWKINEVIFEISEKLDGSSMTVYYRNGDFGVCSRNLDLMETDGNSFWQIANEKDLRDKMSNFNQNIAIQGELIGPGIQGNKYGLKNIKFCVFDIFDIEKQKYLSSFERISIVNELNLIHVPKIDNFDFYINDMTIEDILNFADGKSDVGNCPAREGVVFKSLDGQISFKAISNKWLLKNEE
jgi:RNA ligase (TIGR02306 family)